MLLGATGRPPTPRVRPSSSTRVTRCPISTGWSPLRKALLKLPSTSRSSRRSKPWSPTTRLYRAPSPNRGHAGPSGADRGHCYPDARRASGGIGRRAGFRCLCPKGCGGSSPPSPTDRPRVSVHGRTVAPPSTLITWPVIQLASADIRNATAAAMSSGSPRRGECPEAEGKAAKLGVEVVAESARSGPSRERRSSPGYPPTPTRRHVAHHR